MNAYVLHTKSTPDAEWVAAKGYDVSQLDEARKDCEEFYEAGYDNYAAVTLGNDNKIIHLDYEDVSGEGYTLEGVHEEFKNILANPFERALYDAGRIVYEENRKNAESADDAGFALSN